MSVQSSHTWAILPDIAQKQWALHISAGIAPCFQSTQSLIPARNGAKKKNKRKRKKTTHTHAHTHTQIGLTPLYIGADYMRRADQKIKFAITWKNHVIAIAGPAWLG